MSNREWTLMDANLRMGESEQQETLEQEGREGMEV
jgi:hypothetical protein